MIRAPVSDAPGLKAFQSRSVVFAAIDQPVTFESARTQA